MPGIWPSSFQQIIDAATGKPVVGAVVSFFEAGTTTPLDVYKEYSLGTQHPANIEADADGRWPAVFLDDGFYKFRVRKPGGTLLFEGDGVPVIGISDGTASAAPVDPDTLADIGDIKAHYGTSTLSGWVRCNGRTVGSATSGATERANADCEDLFLHLWTQDDGLIVSGGRGASAADDWAANKTIALPNLRGRVLAGLGSMGGSKSSVIADSLTSSGDADNLGSYGGDDTHTLTTPEIPSHTHGAASYVPGGTGLSPNIADLGWFGTGPSAAAGGGGAHQNMPPFMLVTWFIKL